MYNLYLLSFKLLHAIGMKKTSVRLARSLEKYSRQPLDRSKLYAAVWEFVLNTPAFPFCLGDHGCHLPVLSENDPFHQYCRDAQAENDARIAADEAEADAYLDSRCEQSGCWEDAVKDGYCQKDWDYNFLCGEPGCDKLESECHGDCVQDLSDESDDDLDDVQDDRHDDEECEGGCGQPSYACVCAELVSLRRYNATPMEERCGPWTA